MSNAQLQETVDDSEEGKVTGAYSQYLTFQLAGETYAIDILNIREIIGYGNITTVPMMPEFIAGVINLRGSVVPVIDLSTRFGGKTSEVTKRTSIIIVEVSDEDISLEIGVIVDVVNEVLDIAVSDIEPAPAFGAKIRTDFISGMGKVDGRLLVMLNVENVLSIDELSIVSGLHDQARK